MDFDYEAPIRFLPAEPANIDAFLFAPVQTRHWCQRELYDGTYTLSDLLDYHEMMAVVAENQKRAEDEARRQQEVN